MIENRIGELRYREGSLPEQKESTRTIYGYAVVWNAEANLGGFRERFAPGAFREFLSGEHDIIACFNHDKNALLGRESAGNLRIAEDATGLRYEIDLPETTDANNLLALVRSKIIKGASFHFHLPADGSGERFERDKGGFLRTVIKASVSELGPVASPAYSQSSAFNRAAPEVEGQLRSLAAEQQSAIDIETVRRYLEFLRLKEGTSNN